MLRTLWQGVAGYAPTSHLMKPAIKDFFAALFILLCFGVVFGVSWQLFAF
jgi:hypothetical protein